jgi:crotonobetainyl-CoA:carnitine CoA-transferase CaiB-like acyl-CoA transferase
MKSMSGALDGITILDFTRFQQGTFATALLADLGAEVWKVEQPGGDPGRRLNVHQDGFSAYFESLNRNKRSIVLDLRKSEAIEVVHRMAAKVDIVAENFRPGVMDRLGIGFDVLRCGNPGLIYAEGSMWGLKGPRSLHPGYDNIAQAAGGMMMATRRNEEAPQAPLLGTADQTGGMILAYGVLAALVARGKTGKGQRVDASLYGSQIALQGIQFARALYDVPLNPPGLSSSSFSYRAFCGDAVWIAFGYLTGDFWPKLCKALDLEWLMTDPQFAEPAERGKHNPELVEILDAQVAMRPSTEWLERMAEADVPCTVVQNYQDIARDSQASANSYILAYQTSAFGEAHAQGFPATLSETPAAFRYEAPSTPGIHSSAVLRDAGLSDAETQRLFACGAVQGS